MYIEMMKHKYLITFETNNVYEITQYRYDEICYGCEKSVRPWSPIFTGACVACLFMSSTDDNKVKQPDTNVKRLAVSSLSWPEISLINP